MKSQSITAFSRTRKLGRTRKYFSLQSCTLLSGARKINFRLLKFWIIQVSCCRTWWFPCSLVSVPWSRDFLVFVNQSTCKSLDDYDSRICCTDHWHWFCFCSGWRLHDTITPLQLTTTEKLSGEFRVEQNISEAWAHSTGLTYKLE